MKKLLLLVIPLLVIAGWYFYVRYDNNSRAGAILHSLSRTINYCNGGVTAKQTYLNYERCQQDLMYDRERTAKLKTWAVSQERLDLIAATQKKAEKAVADYANFVEQHKKQQREAEEKKEQLATAELMRKRDEEVKRHKEAKEISDAERKRISDAVATAKRTGGTAPTAAAGGWPLSDPWPSDLKAANVLIWDEKKNEVHSAQEKLSVAIKGSISDGKLLICSVTREHLQPVVEYKQNSFRKKYHWESDATISGKISGHRKWLALRLVRYPEGELIGAYTIVGDEPQSEVFVATNKADRKVIVGDYEVVLSRWLRGRFEPAGAVEKFLAASDSGAAGSLAQEIGNDSQIIGSAALPYLARKLTAATDPAMQYAVIRVVQAAKREHPDYVPPVYAPGTGPADGEPPPRPANIGPPSYAAFHANPRRWLNNINTWLKVQAPGG